MAGVVGRSDIAMNIRGCRNEGSVSYSCTEAPGSYIHIAGIAGALYKGCKVENCTNAATVRSSILQVNRMGGIVGTVNSGGDVLNCVNEGEVCIDQSANDNWQAAGGIVGFEEKCTSETLCHIEGCTNKGAVNIAVNNATTHANKVCAGGIIGFSCSSTDVKGNTNEGPVSIVNAGTGAVYAGGTPREALGNQVRTLTRPMLLRADPPLLPAVWWAMLPSHPATSATRPTGDPSAAAWPLPAAP